MGPLFSTDEGFEGGQLPLGSLGKVAYWLLARGQDWRLHKPVTLCSFLQKFCTAVLEAPHISASQGLDALNGIAAQNILAGKNLLRAHFRPLRRCEEQHQDRVRRPLCQTTNLVLKEQNCWLMTCQITSSHCML